MKPVSKPIPEVKIQESAPRPVPMRQKSVLLPGSPPEIAYAPPRPQTYYEGRSGKPFHNAVGTEMKKTVRMDESTENTRRIVTVEQTSRVIKFGEDQTFDQMQNQCTGPRFQVPTPKKFVQGQFKESDYESDADIGRIRPKWAPSESETEDPQYRKVQPPRFRSSSVPPPQETHERVVTPMEFDRPPAITAQTQTFEQHLRQLNEESARLKKEKRRSYDCSTLPLDKKQQVTRNFEGYTDSGFVTRRDVKKAANRKIKKFIFRFFSSLVSSLILYYSSLRIRETSSSWLHLVLVLLFFCLLFSLFFLCLFLSLLVSIISFGKKIWHLQ